MLSRHAPPKRTVLAASLLLAAISSVSCSKEAAPPPKAEGPIARPSASSAPPTVTSPAPSPTRTTLPDGVVEQRYRANVPPAAGPASTWGIAAGQLPDGLDLGASSGQITGTPRRVGTFDFTVERRENATAPPTPQEPCIRILAGPARRRPPPAGPPPRPPAP